MYVKSEKTAVCKKRNKSDRMEKDPQLCPVCTEVLDMDDLNFYPCVCGYQVCRFCWHRIRTNSEAGVCPLCRKKYSEDPVNFKPISKEELQKIKDQKRQQELKKKQKLAENRKQLGDLRYKVVQKNLVFVHGLPLNLNQDSEKYHKFQQYFRQVGPVYKCIFNNRSANATNQQNQHACAYVTYHRMEDALRALRDIHTLRVGGREVKATLGTTKYCSNYLKNMHCPKVECMYLHELADEEACFTRDEIHAGKHIEYGLKMIEQVLNKDTHSKSSSSSSSTIVENNQKFSQTPQMSPNLSKQVSPTNSEPQTSLPKTNGQADAHPVFNESSPGTSHSSPMTVIPEPKDLPNGITSHISPLLDTTSLLARLSLFQRANTVNSTLPSDVDQSSSITFDSAFSLEKDGCDLDFDPCQHSLDGLKNMMSSEKTPFANSQNLSQNFMNSSMNPSTPSFIPMQGQDSILGLNSPTIPAFYGSNSIGHRENYQTFPRNNFINQNNTDSNRRLSYHASNNYDQSVSPPLWSTNSSDIQPEIQSIGHSTQQSSNLSALTARQLQQIRNSPLAEFMFNKGLI